MVTTTVVVLVAAVAITYPHVAVGGAALSTCVEATNHRPMRHVELSVVDESGISVEQATVTVIPAESLPMPLETGPCSTLSVAALHEGFAFFQSQQKGRTDRSGKVWFEVDGAADTLEVFVEHPGYARHSRKYGLVMQIEKIEATLSRGNALEVIAQTELAGASMKEFGIEMRYLNSVGAVCRQTSDPRIVQVSFVPNGAYAIRGHLSGPGNMRYDSEPMIVELHGEKLTSVGISLLPQQRIVGVLDASVRRPVLDGVVTIRDCAYDIGDPRKEVGRAFKAPINNDGTFEVTGVCSGPIAIWALCDGYCSASEGNSGVGRSCESNVLLHTLGNGNARLAVPAMRTGAVRAVCRDVAGRPVAGRRIRLVVYGCWPIGGILWFPDRTWEGTSNGDGVVVIGNVPRGDWSIGVEPEGAPDSPVEIALEEAQDLRLSVYPGRILETTITISNGQIRGERAR